ncbi:hypothetical protein [Dactylosporangium sp. NPDC051541]|uniref:hypothetical protein n=1 Tax=Dactylosporangium sp. NPDC051541 TaxID=3363977 RepID=UPI0037BA06CC
MTATDLDLTARAADVLAADIHTTKRAGRWAAARWVAAGLARLAADADDDPGEPMLPFSHFVLTRRDTGEELLRVDADFDDHHLLAHVQQQLDELTAGEFLDRWGVTPDVTAGGQ